ncbi:hypothetical protein C7293_22710 [filamentous cyanobacterium CCT1]|nr:hypothetical protein C7293_22710 [filamentous cyanobacterium CCT1]PSN78699.1 hypothetical protein C8B47_15515 [filamentous cyanobacterium CCP4]
MAMAHFSKKSSQQRQLYSTDMEDFHVEICSTININGLEERSLVHELRATIFGRNYDEACENETRLLVGEIVGYKLFNHVGGLLIYADEVDQDLSLAISWLQEQKFENVEFALRKGCLYLSKVEIRPSWQSKVPVLKTVATYLQHTIMEGLVFCRPMPFPKPESQKEVDLKSFRLRQYWSKLGLNSYDSEHNILWEPEWSCPDWLLGQRQLS